MSDAEMTDQIRHLLARCEAAEERISDLETACAEARPAGVLWERVAELERVCEEGDRFQRIEESVEGLEAAMLGSITACPTCGKAR